MSEGKGMFSGLMELSEAAPLKPARPKEPAAPVESPPQVKNTRTTATQRRTDPTEEQDSSLPQELESFKNGYNNRSYRFTAREIRWLRRFCLKVSEAMDEDVSHNTMIRILFRLADDEWTRSSDVNRIIDLLSHIKE